MPFYFRVPMALFIFALAPAIHSTENSRFVIFGRAAMFTFIVALLYCVYYQSNASSLIFTAAAPASYLGLGAAVTYSARNK